MQRTEERKFTDEDGEMTVHTTQLPALRAFRLMARLSKLMGPALAEIKSVKLGEDKLKLLPGLMAALELVDPDEIGDLACQVLEGTLVVAHGKALTLNNTEAINAAFAGRLSTMFKVMAFAVEANFRDFFRGLKSVPSALGATATASAASPSTSQTP